jgi:hypothetical protein
MRTSLLASVVLVPVLAHADPRAICLESTIRDGDKTLSSPTVLALDGTPTSIVIASDGLQLALGLTARARGDHVALDIAYDEKARGVGVWTTRSLSTHVVVKDREPVTLSMPSRQLVITPKTRTAAGSDRCSRAGA